MQLEFPIVDKARRQDDSSRPDKTGRAVTMLYIGIALGISRIFYPETSQLRQISDVAFSYVMMIGLFTVGI